MEDLEKNLFYSVHEVRKTRKNKFIKKILYYFFGEIPTLYWRYFMDRKEMRNALQKEPKNRQVQYPSKIAIIFICAKKYINFLPKFHITTKKYFLPKTPKDFFVFTDQLDYPYLSGKKDIKIIPIKFEKWPFITLKKFKLINKIKKKLMGYSHIIFFDGDMYINSLISEEEFFSHNKPLFGVQHPNFVRKPGIFERNPLSTAAITNKDDLSIYWQGCFFGGKRDYFLKLSEELEKRIDKDLENNFVGNWNDEPHIIKYFIENKNLVYTFNPSYSYPEKMPIQKPFKKKIIHAHKISKKMQI